MLLSRGDDVITTAPQISTAQAIRQAAAMLLQEQRTLERVAETTEQLSGLFEADFAALHRLAQRVVLQRGTREAGDLAAAMMTREFRVLRNEMDAEGEIFDKAASLCAEAEGWEL
jgi:hypothetical protein